jgi:membrane-associated protein
MNPIIPLSAICIYILMIIGIYFNIIPNPLLIVDYINNANANIIYIILFIIILLESIVYLWFYLPWQFIAVLIVVSSAQSISDIFYLTIISIFAVTIWAFINYYLWYFISNKKEVVEKKINYKKLLFSLIHINTISLFIFDQWLKKSPKKIIYLTGLLNLPYYFLMILVTYLLQDQIMTISENSYIILILLLWWLIYSVLKQKKINN